MKIQGSCWTNIGCREINQDAVLYRGMAQEGDCFALCAVCDGVGGLSHGEVASSFLAGRIELWFDEVSKWLVIAQVNTDVLFSHLKDAADCWNEELHWLRRDENMQTGSTMSVLMLIRDRYYIIHVGDSRIYRYRDSLEQLTVDESVLRMKNGRMKSYLANFMGKSETLQFAVSEGLVQEGDMFLVCSDGLYHNLTEEDASLLQWDCRKGCAMDKLCERTVLQMLERGERDNTSMGLVMAEGMEAGSMEIGSMKIGNIAIGSMEAGSMAAGSMTAGSMAAGNMEAGNMGTGSMAAGSMTAGNMAAGNMETGNMEAGSMGTGDMAAENMGLRNMAADGMEGE